MSEPLTNDNCLYGLQCPECSSEGPFQVTITLVVVMHDDGWDSTDIVSDEGMGNSDLLCLACGLEGGIEKFRVANWENK